MIGIIVFIALICVSGVLLFKKLEKGDAMFTLGFIIIAALVILIPIDLAIANDMLKTTETSELVASQNIITLKDTSSSSGRFFLGSGYVGQDEYYYFYTDTENGYKFDKLYAESKRAPVYINYISSSETPHIDRYAIFSRKTLDKQANLWFSVTGYIRYHNHNIGDIISEKVKSAPLTSSKSNYFDNYRYEIHIPEGSIKEDYEINLE